MQEIKPVTVGGGGHINLAPISKLEKEKQRKSKKSPKEDIINEMEKNVK